MNIQNASTLLVADVVVFVVILICTLTGLFFFGITGSFLGLAIGTALIVEIAYSIMKRKGCVK